MRTRVLVARIGMQTTGRNTGLVIRAIGIEMTSTARVIGTATVTVATGTAATGINAIKSTASTGATGNTAHEASMTTNAAIATARATNIARATTIARASGARLHRTSARCRARRLMLLR